MFSINREYCKHYLFPPCHMEGGGFASLGNVSSEYLALLGRVFSQALRTDVGI